MSNDPQNLYTARQSQAIDAKALELMHLTGFELMQKAGQKLFDDLKTLIQDHQRIAIFCGPGNNGGDGLVCAALAKKKGYQVEVFFTDKPNYKNQALQAYELAQEHQVSLHDQLPDNVIQFDVVVDALFGSGLNRPIETPYKKAIDLINSSKLPVLSADIPSGLCSDTGSILGSVVTAHHTSVFVCLKQGLFTGSGPDHSGQIHFHSLDVPKDAFNQTPTSTQLLNQSDLHNKLKRNQNTHKGTYGHSLLIGGFEGMMGAILIAARACLRAGSGLVTVATSSGHQNVLTTAQPEVLTASAANQKLMQSKMQDCQVIAIGPGLDTEEDSQEILLETIQTHKPLVVDADGLNLLAKNPQKKSNWILSPHPKEAARLLKTTSQKIQSNRFEAARELQSQYGGVIILKGCGTLICDSKQNIFVSPYGNPYMATGGMGDALTGILTALLAQGFEQDEAAKLAVLWHGITADKLFAKQHQTILATDLIENLRMDE